MRACVRVGVCVCVLILYNPNSIRNFKIDYKNNINIQENETAVFKTIGII